MGLFGQDGSSVLCLARDNRFFPHSPRLFLRCNSSNSSATLQSVSPPPPRPPLSVALTPAGATTSLCVNARPPDFATLHPKFYLEADGFRRVVEVPAMGTTKNLEAKMLESQGTPPLSCLSVCVCVFYLNALWSFFFVAQFPCSVRNVCYWFFLPCLVFLCSLWDVHTHSVAFCSALRPPETQSRPLPHRPRARNIEMPFHQFAASGADRSTYYPLSEDRFRLPSVCPNHVKARGKEMGAIARNISGPVR